MIAPGPRTVRTWISRFRKGENIRRIGSGDGGEAPGGAGQVVGNGRMDHA
jgi:hypothetical protein